MVAPVINMPNTAKHNGISGIPTQLLVLHSAECPLRGGYAQSLTLWANIPLEQGGPIASWQRFVDPIARVRMVPDQYAAWHASEANPMSIGWEQAGYARFTRAEWETPEGLKQLDNLAYDMAEVAKRDGIPPVWLTTDQVEAVTHRGNRSIKGFCIHAQIDPDMRTDPGSNYPYDRLMDRIKHYLGSSSGAISPASGNITPAKPAPKPKEWDEMASKNDIKAALREVIAEPPILDKIALALLKRDCYLVDPSGKSGKVTGTTTLAKKVNWMAHNDAQLLNVLVAIGEKLGVQLDTLIEMHEEEPGESVPELKDPAEEEEVQP